MKSIEAISKALDRIDSDGTNFPAMTYEQGVCEALMWVLEELGDDEFEFSK